jgi:hypothetical protein
MLLVGGAAVAALLRGTAESARELTSEIARFGELHAALARVRTELQHTGTAVREVRTAHHRR